MNGNPHHFRAAMLFRPDLDAEVIRHTVTDAPLPPHRALARIVDTLTAQAAEGMPLWAEDARALALSLAAIRDAVTPEPPVVRRWPGAAMLGRFWR